MVLDHVGESLGLEIMFSKLMSFVAGIAMRLW